MPVFIKYFIIAMLVMIVTSLGVALYRMAMNRDGEDSTAMVKALAVRVGLSVALFAMLMILSALGIITPHG